MIAAEDEPRLRIPDPDVVHQHIQPEYLQSWNAEILIARRNGEEEMLISRC
jgi:hypothetical protein